MHRRHFTSQGLFLGVHVLFVHDVTMAIRNVWALNLWDICPGSYLIGQLDHVTSVHICTNILGAFDFPFLVQNYITTATVMEGSVLWALHNGVPEVTLSKNYLKNLCKSSLPHITISCFTLS